MLRWWSSWKPTTTLSPSVRHSRLALRKRRADEQPENVEGAASEHAADVGPQVEGAAKEHAAEGALVEAMLL